MPTQFEFFVTGTKGFETALFHEIREIVSSQDTEHQIRKVYGGINLQGGLELAYRVCLYSRLANRVYLQLGSFKADTEQALYDEVYKVDWSRHMGARGSLAVSASLSRSKLDHSHYASLKVKDAIVDQFRNQGGSRPIVDKNNPDLHIHLNIHKNNATLSLDLSGQSLHRRGYRLEHSGAPLKENLAAALLIQSGWTAKKALTHQLIDPMCGSGTFVIEAAMIASNIAPGLDRQKFGFSRWVQHDDKLWQACLLEAENAISIPEDCQLMGSDLDQRAIEIARDNAHRAGVEELIEFRHQPLSELKPGDNPKPVIFILNPPYGERLQAEQGLARLYQEMGQVFRQFDKAEINIISANPDLLHRLRLDRFDKKSVKNGPLDCLFVRFRVATAKKAAPEPQNVERTPVKIDLSEDARALKNRLGKNDKHLSKWAKRQGVECYRLYDADLPEFAFALDRYRNALNPDQCWYHLQEYQAPKNIEEAKAAARIETAKSAIVDLFGIPESDLYCKTRRRQRGSEQYEKFDHQAELFQVREGDARLLINLSDYLDSGLFLDHRATRQIVQQEIKGRSLLNLFCYTGSVSVQAALAGANSVTSVDMSATYINWCKENFEINDLVDEKRYQFLQADCLDLLNVPGKYLDTRKFDVIFLDPPSFSNSKRMQQTLDIQRDHEKMILQAMKMLSDDGQLYFSTNKKGFKLEKSLQDRFSVTDITAKTIPEDFKRRPKIHQCWILETDPNGK